MMKIAVTMLLPVVNRLNADCWNALRSCQCVKSYLKTKNENDSSDWNPYICQIRFSFNGN